jgi:hypothetical protein
MNSTRKIAVITSVIFIIATLASLSAAALTPVLTGADYLAGAFTVGGCMYYVLFFQSRLVPRWLSGWGLVAIILMMAACVLALFSDSSITGYILLAFPIFLQEMVLAVWLIVKGFDSYPGAQPDNRVNP